MLYGLIVTLFIINAFVLIILVLIQKTKSSMGLGSMGGGSQLLFGGSSGQDFLQKTTWALGFSLMFLVFVGAIVRSRETQTSRYISAAPTQTQQTQSEQMPAQEMPALPIEQAPAEQQTPGQESPQV